MDGEEFILSLVLNARFYARHLTYLKRAVRYVQIEQQEITGGVHLVFNRVHVLLAESTIAALQDELYATEGNRVTLGCYTVESQPIAYCRFLTPRQFGFAVDEQSPSGRYAYSGLGLTAGHCGLSLDRVHDSDYGNWTCAVKILDSTGSQEVSITIVLRKPEGRFSTILIHSRATIHSQIQSPVLGKILLKSISITREK